jgi:hypothetical protein
LYDRIVLEDFPNRMWWDMPHNPAEPHQKSPAKTAKNKQIEIQPDGNIKPMDNELPGQVSPRAKGRAGGSKHHARSRKTGPSLGGKYQRNV